ncbi:MAG: alpha-glucan family phosphorylase [bacterium]|nr:alpha-glucan family phosphorylase [bacterium]
MNNKSIAFICAEFGIEESLPIYAGGLGILAGDFVLEAGKQGLDFNAVGLFYNGQSPSPETAGFELLNYEDKVWHKKYGTANLYLIDGGEITKQLYGPDDIAMLKQQILLGFGAVKLFKLLNLHPYVWHLNEGHTALTALALSPGENIVATKHTILPGAGLHLEWEKIKPFLDVTDEFMSQASYKNNPKYFSTTAYLLHRAVRANAVSTTHADFERSVHPDSKLFPITNGVSVDRWLSPNSKIINKKNLFDHLKDKYGLSLNPDVLTIVWARRLATYKRPHLLFEDLSRLSGIVNSPTHPVQIIMAGKASASDMEGQGVAGKIMDACERPEIKNKVVFIPDYDIPLAKLLVAGADVCLNTPLPGQEACGTSGMKAGLNGALMLSTADGWMAELDWSNIGWILFEHGIVENLYNLIETLIAPLYYDNKPEWATRMQKTRDIVLKNYTTRRMVKEYLEKLYFPNL